MVLPRALEPEGMDTEEEALDYDAMDHTAVNDRFVADFLVLRPRLARVLDVGTGTALIPIELARWAAYARVEAIDLSGPMLALARRNVERAKLGDRIRLLQADAKNTGFAPGSFDAVISNSIVHHVPDPRDMLAEAWRVLRSGGRLFVRDLERPPNADRVAQLVAAYAPIPAATPAELRPRMERQRALLDASLRAALTVYEVRAMAAQLGISPEAVHTTSDRHWTLACVKP